AAQGFSARSRRPAHTRFSLPPLSCRATQIPPAPRVPGVSALPPSPLAASSRSSGFPRPCARFPRNSLPESSVHILPRGSPHESGGYANRRNPAGPRGLLHRAFPPAALPPASPLAPAAPPPQSSRRAPAARHLESSPAWKGNCLFVELPRAASESAQHL